MRRLSVCLLAIGGCGPSEASECDEVAAPEVVRPDPIDRAGPIAIGESLPVHHMTRRVWTADELAGAAMLLACAMRPDVRASAELFAWSEDAAAAPGVSIDAMPFGGSLVVTSVPGILQIYDAAIEPTATTIDTDAAIAVADEALARLGLAPDAFDPAPTNVATTTTVTPDSVVVDHHRVTFGFAHAGIRVIGPLLHVEVASPGELWGLGWSELDVEHVGTATIVLDEPAADARFRELVIADNEIEGSEPNFGTGEPAYMLRVDEAEGEYGVRWRNEYSFTTAGGIVSRTDVAALSMTDADAPLDPITP